MSGPAYTWAQPIPPELVPEGLSIAAPFDGEKPVPSCRNADRPYGPDNYVVTVDGFIASANVAVREARVYDTSFMKPSSMGSCRRRAEAMGNFEKVA